MQCRQFVPGIDTNLVTKLDIRLETRSARAQLLPVSSFRSLQNMVYLAMNTPIQDGSVCQVPLEIVSRLLQEVTSDLFKTQ